jgi:hypothetical protein
MSFGGNVSYDPAISGNITSVVQTANIGVGTPEPSSVILMSGTLVLFVALRTRATRSHASKDTARRPNCPICAQPYFLDALKSSTASVSTQTRISRSVVREAAVACV